MQIKKYFPIHENWCIKVKAHRLLTHKDELVQNQGTVTWVVLLPVSMQAVTAYTHPLRPWAGRTVV